ncbi:MAG: branched-chain amino acid ABC transporter permease [Hyphomicrobiaceae bacterium]
MMRVIRQRPVATAIALLSLAVLLVLPITLGRFGNYMLAMWATMTIAAMGLNLTLGYAGQISLAQGAFVGIGAYISAIMTTNGWPLGAALVVAIVVCFAIGWLLGYPALRVQHHYLAFVTLSFSTLAYLVFRNEEWLTKGTYGIYSIPRPTILGYSLKHHLDFYYFALMWLVVISLLMWWLVRSPWGRAFTALRENPLRAQSLGVDTRLYTLMAFAIGSTMGGVAGVLYAPLVEFIDPNPFALALSFNLLLMVIVGGSGYFLGPFLGALIAVLLPEWLRDYTSDFYLVAYALLVMILLIFSPTGILGLVDRLATSRRARRASEARAAETPRIKAKEGA